MINSQVKSNLAKLLATENLTVEHSNVPTASFNVETRVLQLPVWDDISNDVYDLLVGHEVGHALFTPNEYSTRKHIPQSFLNVIEDARIERKIKSQYPGLTKSFYRGYAELNEKDFFEIKDENLKEMNLIDRINLYFKIGIHDVATLIPFDEEENQFVDMTKNAETFEDVVFVCEAILKYVRDKIKNNQETQQASTSSDQSESMQFDVEEVTPEESERPDLGDDDTDYEEWDDNEEESDNSNSSTNIDGGYAYDEEYDDEETSVTDTAWDRNKKGLVSDSVKDHLYIKVPDIEWDKCIESVDVFSQNMDYNFQYIDERYSVNPYDDMWKSSFLEFKQESKKSVAYLTKEFEMKKRADEYNRSSESKTGVLNTNKLFAYKWSDDVFKKNNVIPTGKNHGLIMYIDWSGSMYNSLLGTIKQLINLITFCKKVNIPFQVFAFTDSANYDPSDKFLDPKTEHEFVVDSRFRLVEMFNSDVKQCDFDNLLYKIWCLTHLILRRSNAFPHGSYDLNGTPLNDTVFAAVHVFKKFKQKYKVDKVNTVFLTDGESNSATYSKECTYDDKTFMRRKYLSYDVESQIICLKDPKTGYLDMNIAKQSCYNRASYKITAGFIRYYKWMTKSNVVGFRLTEPTDLKQLIRQSGADTEKENLYRKDWKTSKSFIINTLGYDELYVIQCSKGFKQEEPTIVASSSDSKSKIRNQFKKYMKSKMFNKIILSKFVDQIA